MFLLESLSPFCSIFIIKPPWSNMMNKIFLFNHGTYLTFCNNIFWLSNIFNKPYTLHHTGFIVPKKDHSTFFQFQGLKEFLRWTHVICALWVHDPTPLCIRHKCHQHSRSDLVIKIPPAVKIQINSFEISTKNKSHGRCDLFLLWHLLKTTPTPLS